MGSPIPHHSNMGGWSYGIVTHLCIDMRLEGKYGENMGIY
jgi:hypothetical protein